MENKELIDTLKKAFDMEEKGYEFYREAGKKSTSEIVKNTFNFLADNEILHMHRIKDFYNILSEKGEFPKLNLKDEKTKRTEEANIFSKSISAFKDKIKPSDDEKKALEFAMEFENEGHKHYSKMLEKAEDENLIKLLKFLIEEESMHYESLKKTYEYVSDTHNWFMYEEGSFPQG